jgi:carbamoyltransferase
MNVLGISSYYHDSAACLFRDGKLVAAVQEERFNRKKNSPDFPIRAINHCIQSSGISFGEIDYISFYEKPYLKFSRVIFDHIRSFPFSYIHFLRTMPQWLQDRLILPITLKKEIGFEGKTLFVKHHHSHAASTFFMSPYDEAAILIADGVGELATTSWGYGEGNNIHLSGELHYPDSLGLLYSAVTTYLGFRANSAEGTTMALASFGKPAYLQEFKKMVKLMPDGSFRMDQSYFGFSRGSRMYSSKFIRLLGPPRKQADPIEERHRDVAASLQAFVEEVLITAARYVYEKTGKKKLCLAGGVFLNCVANQKILDQTDFESVFIQPGAGDAGGAIGAAAYASFALLGQDRKYPLEHAYLGPSFNDDEILKAIAAKQLKYSLCEEDEMILQVAEMVSNNQTVGWFQGALEFGPRALGHRSILANAANPEMVEILNHRIKHREWFRPFAPLVPEELASDYFEMKGDGTSPFMLLAPAVKQDKREVVKAITHIDGTARVQTVSSRTNPLLHKLLMTYKDKYGIPVIINTSFNLKGEPIVCTPEEAINDFLKSEMDALVLHRYILRKENNNVS